jgi:hypothetical protein
MPLAAGDPPLPARRLRRRLLRRRLGWCGLWQSYATTGRDASFKITSVDIDGLTAAGHTEEEIFEVTVAAVVGAATHGFDAGRRPLAHKTTG